jgi:hypothetical protein
MGFGWWWWSTVRLDHKTKKNVPQTTSFIGAIEKSTYEVEHIIKKKSVIQHPSWKSLTAGLLIIDHCKHIT